MTKPRYVTMFAGCGGSSQGYKDAGYQGILAIDWDADVEAIYRANFPDIPFIRTDITNLSGRQILKKTGLKKGELDVLDGSPPCQGFSMIGKRKVEDERNDLFTHYIRILKTIKPKVFIGENVAGMIRGRMKFVFGRIFKDMQAAGYRVRARLMDAQNYQVPQRRQRVIFIGVRKDLEGQPTYPKPILPKKTLKRLDDSGRPCPRFQYNKWNTMLVRPGMICYTVTTQSHFYWAEDLREMGIKSYAYAQGFPEDFDWPLTFQKNLKAIGNAVPPPMMKAIATHVRKTLLEPNK